MKYILGLIIGLAALQAGLVSAQGISERYPTNAEIQKLKKDFELYIQSQQRSPVASNYMRDRRTASQKKYLQSFVQAWSKVNPTVAPFLGTWSGYEQIVSIYPTRVTGRVCLIITGEGMGHFTRARVSNSLLKTEELSVYLKSKNYLAELIVQRNRAILNSEIPLNNPFPLVSPQQRVEGYVIERAEKRTIIRNFNSQGCLSSLP